jgi:succinate dehydrogenase / fumarate reductase, iron-sulfur subunit
MSESTVNAEKYTHFRIWRQATEADPNGSFEEFKIPYRKGANVISCLMEIQRNPVNAKGEKTTPVVWDSNCLEEVCGSCTMNINGKVRMACSTLIDKLEQPITLEPMRKFAVTRDLAVDRQRMFEDLKKVKAWVNLDGTHDLGPGPRQAPHEQEVRYVLSTCMTCGCCLEACPQYLKNNDFIGAFAIGQTRLFNTHPSGKFDATARLRGLMGEGGIQDCGKAQNCVEVCPKEIPLTTTIMAMNRQVTGQLFKDLFARSEQDEVKGSGAG